MAPSAGDLDVPHRASCHWKHEKLAGVVAAQERGMFINVA